MDNKFLDFQGGKPRSYQYSSSYESKPRMRNKPIQKTSSVGRLVEHDEMGRGVVIEENENILTVAFRTRGIKKVARQYLAFVD